METIDDRRANFGEKTDCKGEDVEPGLDKEGTECTGFQVKQAGGEAEAPQGETEALEKQTAESQGESVATQEDKAETSPNLAGLETDKISGVELCLDTNDDRDYKPDDALPPPPAADTAKDTETPQVISSDAELTASLQPRKPSPDDKGAPVADSAEEVKEADKPQTKPHLFGRSRSPRPGLAPAEIVAEDGSKFKLMKKMKEDLRRSRYKCLLCGSQIQKKSIDDHLASKGHIGRVSTSQSEGS
jgi:hypothetical protein